MEAVMERQGYTHFIRAQAFVESALKSLYESA